MVITDGRPVPSLPATVHRLTASTNTSAGDTLGIRAGPDPNCGNTDFSERPSVFRRFVPSVATASGWIPTVREGWEGNVDDLHSRGNYNF